MSKVLAAPHVWFVVGGVAFAASVVADNQPLGIVGGAVAATSLSLLLVDSAWVRAASTRDPAVGEPVAALPPHVLDGTRPDPLGSRLVRTVSWSAVFILGGAAALETELVAVGIVLLMVGLQVAILNLGMMIKVRRHGVTWREDEARWWPTGSRTGEIVKVWEESDSGIARTHGFWIRVDAPTGAWEVRTRQVVPEQWMSALRPGLRVQLRADPDRPHLVPIDWSTSSPPA